LIGGFVADRDGVLATLHEVQDSEDSSEVAVDAEISVV
jgi:hypothetical protein